MTSNQIKYWDLQERKRANLANEKETNRSNLAREGETSKHNRITEAETERHNRATELLSTTAQQEVQRHNMAVELQADRQQQEVERANLERESNARNQISLGYANLGLGYGQLAELQRSNQAREAANLLSIQETQRYNTLRANIDMERNDETIRSNKAREDQERLNWITNLGQRKDEAANTQKHDRTTEAETERSHKANEFWKGLETISNTVESQTRSVKNIGTLIGGMQ